jgi:hypothetical protein
VHQCTQLLLQAVIKYGKVDLMVKLLRFDIIFLAVIFSASCYRAVPKIDSIDPQIAEAGGTVTVSGKNFGTERDESFVSFDGVTPTLSSYQTWSDNTIVVRIPDFGESGLVYVHRNGKKSNPMLFSILDDMPVVPESAALFEPLIELVEPAEASIGSVITIKGSNFGAPSDGAAILFSSGAGMTALNVDRDDDSQFIKTRAGSDDILSWTKNEIKARIPDGTLSGDIMVATQKTKSGGARLVISGMPGEKTFKDKKTYVLNYAVNVRVEEAEIPNSLFINIPTPADTAFQRNQGLVSQSAVPFIDNYRGAALYRFDNLSGNTSKDIAVSYLVDVYTIESKPDINQIKSAADMSGKQQYVRNSFFIEATEEIKKRSLAIIRRETNTYIKARAIFRAVLQEESMDGSEAARYFCALCRAAGVPALPVAGVLIVHNKIAVPHLWSMFWIDGLGWLPVDIALARGEAPEGFPVRPEAEYYFGNSDSNRIIFSFGGTVLMPMLHNGKTSSGNAKYALQNIGEESTSGLIAYSTLWSDIEITGVY